MRNIVLVSLFLLFNVHSTVLASAPVWGKTGHRVTAQVAEKYLTPVARQKVKALLKGKSLALVSTFGDDIKSDDRFRKYSPWHYVNYPLNKEYEDQRPSDQGDIVMGIAKCVEVLEDPKASDEDKEFFLKMLVHFIGDLHQPMHIGKAEDKGGNDIQVRWFSEGSNLHRVWDSNMIDEFQMSYTELSNNLPVLTPDMTNNISRGDYKDWMRETRQLTKEVYASARIGEKLGYRYMYDHFGEVRMQLLKGGIRLAAMLNDIFDPTSTK